MIKVFRDIRKSLIQENKISKTAFWHIKHFKHAFDKFPLLFLELVTFNKDKCCLNTLVANYSAETKSNLPEVQSNTLHHH